MESKATFFFIRAAHLLLIQAATTVNDSEAFKKELECADLPPNQLVRTRGSYSMKGAWGYSKLPS